MPLLKSSVGRTKSRLCVNSDTERRSPRLSQALRVRTLGFRTSAFGLLGLVTGELARSDAGVTQAELTGTPLGAFLMWLFIGCLLGGVLVLVPASSILERRAHRLDGLPFDRWELPGWLGWPLWIIVTAGSLFLACLLFVLIVRLVLDST